MLFPFHLNSELVFSARAVFVLCLYSLKCLIRGDIYYFKLSYDLGLSWKHVFQQYLMHFLTKYIFTAGGIFYWQTNTFLTHTDIGGNPTNIDVRDKLFLYNFLQGCFAQFGIVKKCRIRVNVRPDSLAYDLASGVDLSVSWVISLSLSPHIV